jgi:hypothetical protein
MAITNPWSVNGVIQDDYSSASRGRIADLPYPVEHIINGKMLIASYSIMEYKFSDRIHIAGQKQTEDEIKDELLMLLVNEMKKSNFIEYTRQIDILSGAVNFKARIFVTPNDQVRLIREIEQRKTK